MGFFKNLFKKIGKKDKEEAVSGEWEEQDSSVPANLDDADVRTVCVLEALGRMAEAFDRVEEGKDEYDAVTSLLVDMEKIDGLPKQLRLEITDLADNIEKLEKKRRELLLDSGKMSEKRIQEIERLEDSMPEGIKKIREAEHYRKLVIRDLKRLDAERDSYRYRIKEARITIENARGVAVICAGAMIACILLLMVLKFAYEMDVTWGYLIICGVGAVTLTGLFVKYSDANRSLSQLEKIKHKMITVHNTVRIRYVNNTKLLSYMYMKYGAESADELEEDWNTYTSEMGARIKDRELKAELEYNYDSLTQKLEESGVKDPQIWTRQTEALLDPREMVEVRHALIARRQKLREQLEYNKGIAEEEGKRIKDMARAYPQYSDEIANIVKRYEH